MASRSLNKVMLIGNLTRDPELRYTPQGTAVCTFGVATNRTWVSNGQQQEDAEFHRIVAWQKLAELCSQLLFKGRKVFVEGRLQTRKWTGADGQERVTTEIVIDNMIVLDSRRREGEMGVMPSVPTLQTPAAATRPQDDKMSGKKKEEKKTAKKKAVTDKGKMAVSTDKKAASADEEKPEEVKVDDIPF